jgi:hypothetical protein
LQRRATGGAAPSAVPSIVHEVLRSPGQPLDPAIRAFMEPRFGHDFSRVRVHADGRAAESARAVDSLAYTVGRDVVFGVGQYLPGTSAGQKLLAHELSHVVQQRGQLQQHSVPLRVNTSGEADAQEAACDVLAGRRAESVARVDEVGVQRQFAPEQAARIPRVGEMPRVIPRVGPVPIPPVGPVPGLGDTEPEVEIEDDVSELDEPMYPGEQPEPSTTPSPAPSQTPKTSPAPEPFPPLGPSPRTGDSDEQKDPCGSNRLPLTKVTWSIGPQGQAGIVKASPLTRCPGNTRGSQARASVYQAQFNCIKKAGKTRTWYPCHLLHGWTRRTGARNLHGPGNEKWNIIIGDVGLNTNMYATVEGWALTRVYDLSQVLWLESKVDSYFPGAEFFAKQITVRYGLYNTNAGTEGPQLDSQSFNSTEVPPSCPTTLPVVAAPQPKMKADFESTISICLTQLKSRVFPVTGGGLKVRLRARGQGTDCSISDYFVALWKKNPSYWPDGKMSETKVPAGKAVTLTWRNVYYGDYYFIFSVGPHAPGCCLKGDISVGTFAVLREGPIA